MSSLFGYGVNSSYNTTATTHGILATDSYYLQNTPGGGHVINGDLHVKGTLEVDDLTTATGGIQTSDITATGTITCDTINNSTGPLGTGQITTDTLITTVGSQSNSIQINQGGVEFYENAYNYFTIDNSVPGGNTLRIMSYGTTPGAALTVSEEGVVSLERDAIVGGQLVVEGPLDVSGVIVGTSASIEGTLQANTANVNNITAATSILYVSAPGGVQVANDLTMTNSAILNVSDIGLVGPDARISLNSCISDPVFTTLQTSLDTNGVPPGGSVSYTLNRSSDTPNNWDSGLYAVNCTLTVGGAGVPYYQGMFSYSPNNVATIFNAYANGFGLTIGADGFGNPILEFFNNTGSTWTTPSNLKITKLC